MNYSIEQIKQLAKTNPQELTILLSSATKDIPLLSNGIEILSEENIKEELIIPLFKKLLKHVHVLVRESTVLAISNYYEKKLPPNDILIKVEAISKNDPSNDLREFASDILNNFG